jgi:asparagine N-glycosylation enzyme membrane subunit Stt3
MNKERLSSKEAIFPVVVLVASIFALFQQTYFLNILSFVVSLVGIVGVWLFYKNNRYFQPLFFVWILVQLLIIDKVTLLPSGANVHTVYWDVTQGVNLKFGLSAGTLYSKTTVHINILL